MRRARAYISPGVEDFGLAAAQALCAGVPLVAGCGSGVSEIAPYGYVQSFDPEVPSDFRRSAEGILNVPRLSPEMRRRLRRLLSHKRFGTSLRTLVALEQ